MDELLGERIKTLRIVKGFTQEQIADKTGIGRQKYARIEKGVDNITLDVLSKIAIALNVTVGDITRVLDENPITSYSTGIDNLSTQEIFNMIDFFYANKRMYEKLQRDPNKNVSVCNE